MYTKYATVYYRAIPLLSAFPFLILLCSPFVPLYLLGTLLAVIGSVHLVPRLLVNWSSHFPPLAHIPLIPNPGPPGSPRSKYTFIRMTSRTWLTRSSTILAAVQLQSPNFNISKLQSSQLQSPKSPNLLITNSPILSFQVTKFPS
jgi:hypothetical protein